MSLQAQSEPLSTTGMEDWHRALLWLMISGGLAIGQDKRWSLHYFALEKR